MVGSKHLNSTRRQEKSQHQRTDPTRYNKRHQITCTHTSKHTHTSVHVHTYGAEEEEEREKRFLKHGLMGTLCACLCAGMKFMLSHERILEREKRMWYVLYMRV